MDEDTKAVSMFSIVSDLSDAEIDLFLDMYSEYGTSDIPAVSNYSTYLYLMLRMKEGSFMRKILRPDT